MLIGQYISKLTDKNRLSVPKKFRQEIGDDIIIAKWYEGCLVIVSKENWNRLKKRLIGETGLITSPVRDIDRFVLGSAFEISLDDQGRFVILDNLMNYADITDEVVFVGLEDRIEIWSANKWRDIEKSAMKKATAALEEIANRKQIEKGGDADD